MLQVRKVENEDLDACRRICIETATHYDTTKPAVKAWLLEQYCDPYVLYLSETSFVATEDGEVVGYIFSASDGDYLKTSKAHFKGGPLSIRIKRAIRFAGLSAEKKNFEKDYPYHLHIDFTESARGKGGGRLLTDTLISALKEKNAAGLHLGVGKYNTNAHGFYKHLGFEVLIEAPNSLVFGKKLNDNA